MTLIKTLNTLRRDAVTLAMHSLGLRKKTGVAPGKPRVFDTTAMRRPATPVQPLLMPTAMVVKAVVPETADAVSLVLARQDGQPVHFTPGMFFTLILTVDRQEYRRAYSVSSAVHQADTATVTVKRVAGGLVSNWINDRLRPGDVVPVLGPSGSFTLTPDAARARNLLLVGGGSGITPLMSMIRSVLEQEPDTRIHLLYGNRGMEDIIFSDALSMLEQEYDERLAMTHVLENPPAEWQGGVGRLDRPTFAALLDGILAHNPIAELEVYTCGPEPMMEAVQAEVMARGLPADHFHQERFTPAARPADANRFSAQPMQVRYGGKTWSARAEAGQTLLEAGLTGGAPMQFSCALGGCGRCRVKVTEGRVDMPEPNCLLPEEKAQGYALACIAHACSPVVFDIDPPTSH
jgi:ferredoxin-NADP reductase